MQDDLGSQNRSSYMCMTMYTQGMYIYIYIYIYMLTFLFCLYMHALSFGVVRLSSPDAAPRCFTAASCRDYCDSWHCADSGSVVLRVWRTSASPPRSSCHCLLPCPRTVRYIAMKVGDLDKAARPGAGDASLGPWNLGT